MHPAGPETAADSSVRDEPALFPEGIPAAAEEQPAPAAFVPAESAEAVFGPFSQLKAVVPVDPPQKEVNDQRLNELMLDGLTVALFALYFIRLFRHRSSIGLLFRSLAVKGQFDQLIDEQSVAFRSFIRSFRSLGFLVVLALIFKACLIWNATPSVVRIPENYLPFLLPVLIGVLLAILCYKWLITGTIAVLSGQTGRVENIRTFNRIYFVTATFLLTPVVLLTTLSDPATQRVLFALEATLLIVLVLYYVGKSFSFFVSRKISILQWILYLCAVEIMPVSFFVLFAARGFEW